MASKIISCKCPHLVQDKLHGPGKRAHNYSLKANDGSGGWRCTVCLDIKGYSAKYEPVD